ncbi:UNVERIFIED_CONTAM: Eml2 [Trichonephila clavipes]
MNCNNHQLSNVTLHFHYAYFKYRYLNICSFSASLHSSLLGFGWKRVAISFGPKNPKDLLEKRRVRHGRFLAVGSHDNYIYVYQVDDEYKKYNRIGRCMGHSSFITHLDWSEDRNAGVCRQVSNMSIARDLKWITQTCTIGFSVLEPIFEEEIPTLYGKNIDIVHTKKASSHTSESTASYLAKKESETGIKCIPFDKIRFVYHAIKKYVDFDCPGIWPENADGSDVNTCSRSHNQKLVATGDDFGKVNIYSYPACQPKAPHHSYGGHSSHVTNVDFTPDDTRLISLGGLHEVDLIYVIIVKFTLAPSSSKYFIHHMSSSKIVMI